MKCHANSQQLAVDSLSRSVYCRSEVTSPERVSNPGDTGSDLPVDRIALAPEWRTGYWEPRVEVGDQVGASRVKVRSGDQAGGLGGAIGESKEQSEGTALKFRAVVWSGDVNLAVVWTG